MTFPADLEGFELSLRQEGLMAVRGKGFVGYAQGLMRVDGDPAEIPAALSAMVARHEILRTRIQVLPGSRQALQVVHAAPEMRFECHDLRGLDRRAQEAETAALASRARASLSPATEEGYVPRFDLVALAEGRSVLLATLDPLHADSLTFEAMAAELAEAGPAGREEPLQYSQFAQWQRENEPEAVAPGPSVAVWPALLAGTRIGESELISDSGSLCSELRLRLSDLGISASALFTAVLHVLVRDLTDADQAVGAVLPGRELPDLVHAFGPYALVVRVRGNRGRDTSLVLLAAEMEAGLRSARFGGLQGSEVLTESCPCVVAVDEPSPADLSGGVLWAETHAEPCAVRLTVALRGERVGLRWRYDRSRMADEIVAGWDERLHAVLDHLINGGEPWPEELLLASPRERAELVGDFNATDRPDPRVSRLAHTLIEEKAHAHPDRIAVISDHGSLTFGDLVSRAGALGQELTALGIGPETTVGIRVSHGHELPIAILATLKAGGAYVPIDPALPAARALELLSRAGCRALLTTSGESDLGFGGPMVRIDEGRSATKGVRLAEPVADNLAYVLFTSGSSGAPKAVMVTHGGLVNYLLWSAKTYLSDQPGTSVVHTPVGFDLTVTSLLTPLAAGRTIELMAEAQVDPLALVRRLGADDDIGLVKLTPSHLRILNHERAGRPGVTLVVGGEALTGDLVDPWPGARVFNEYGPTETVVGCCVQVVSGSTPRPDGLLPIGTPIDNMRLYVLDELMRPVGRGVTGELYIGGPGVARGYWDGPGITAEAFLPDPFASHPGRRLYRTGDLACHLPAGGLLYLGRSDEQVKIRGVRVEPQEVAAALRAHPSVREAVVLAGGTDQHRTLSAFAVLEEETEAADMRGFLADKLPAWMIPDSIIAVDELPLTANGKLDAGALAGAVERLGGPGAGPNDVIELRLLGIIEELVARRPLSVADDFFEVGGHSLLAVQLLARIEKEFGVVLPLSLFFEEGTATAATLASALRNGAEMPARMAVCLSGPESGKPVFVVPPAGGEVLGYRHLALCLDAGRPVYALYEHKSAPSGRPSVSAFAEAHLPSIYEVQPDGPFTLVGWSFGGAVAFELARLLMADGHEVDRVILLDAYLGPRPDGGKDLVTDFACEIGRVFDVDLLAKVADLDDGDSLEMSRRLLDEAAEAGILPEDMGSDYLIRWFDRYVSHVRAISAYRPHAQPLEVMLVQAPQPDAGRLELAVAEWREVAGSLVVYRLPTGDHQTMLDPPHVASLAAYLRPVLLQESR